MISPFLNSLILDRNKNSSASYSLRKLKPTAKKAIRVRKSDDNSELDIGFSGIGLDTVALISFVGANSAYIKTWYDQSGNGNDLSQTDTTKQPLIVSSGSLITDNGKPAIQFNGTSNFLKADNSESIDITTSPLYLNAVYSVDVSVSGTGYIICKNVDAATNRQYALDYLNTTPQFEFVLENGQTAIGASNSVTKGVQAIASALWDNNTTTVYVNGVASGGSIGHSGSLTSRSTLYIGCRGHTASTQTGFFKGKISEIHIMKTINRIIEIDQKKFHNIA